MFPWEIAVASCLSTGFVSEAGAGELAAEIAKAASRLTSDERGVRTVRPLRGRQASAELTIALFPGVVRLSAASDDSDCRHSPGRAKWRIGNPWRRAVLV